MADIIIKTITLVIPLHQPTNAAVIAKIVSMKIGLLICPKKVLNVEFKAPKARPVKSSNHKGYFFRIEDFDNSDIADALEEIEEEDDDDWDDEEDEEEDEE